MSKPLQDHPHMSCLHPTPTCPLNFFQINVGIFTALEEIISPEFSSTQQVWAFCQVQLSPRGTSILGEVRNVEIPGPTQQQVLL